VGKVGLFAFQTGTAFIIGPHAPVEHQDPVSQNIARVFHRFVSLSAVYGTSVAVWAKLSSTACIKDGFPLYWSAHTGKEDDAGCAMLAHKPSKPRGWFCAAFCRRTPRPCTATGPAIRRSPVISAGS